MQKCIECGKEYQYDRKKGHRKNCCNSCMVNKRRMAVDKKCLEYKGGKCELCGYSKCKRSLQFHHIKPETKTFQISGNWGLSWEKLKTELDKCILVCANCHGEIHEGLWQTGNAADF